MTKQNLDVSEAARTHPATEHEIKAFERGLRVLDARWDGRSTLSVEEAADVLGLSRASAYAAANAGDIPVIRIGRRLVVPRHALERLLTSVA
jgi:excisionase family DNA binding protein